MSMSDHELYGYPTYSVLSLDGVYWVAKLTDIVLREKAMDGTGKIHNVQKTVVYLPILRAEGLSEAHLASRALNRETDG